jgi:prolyl-tRNA synthetase
MRYSKLLLPTLKETPTEAEVVSHRLLLRAGFIRKLSSGVYTYLPLGLASIRKVEQIVREEMNRAGAQELLMPMVQPADLWKESGRWEKYGPELLRFTDRHDRKSCLGPTHEEVITDLVRREIHSYRFDATEEGTEVTYQKMYDAYHRIFKRCGLSFRAVEADTGTIGGSFSHEFMVLADTGEDTLVICKQCDYAANMEKATVKQPVAADTELLPLQKVETPGKRKVGAVCEFLEISPQELIKTMVYLADGKPVAVLVRGDHEVQPVKLKNMLGAVEVELADDKQVFDSTGVPSGYLGPIDLNIPVLADLEVEALRNFTVGANEKNYHMQHVNLGRDFKVSQVGDLRQITEDDPCPECSGGLELTRGIEVGHIFKLGDSYSKALKATFQDSNSEEQNFIMGCYGIGVSRTVAAAIEQNHDENGIIFPLPLAPFQAIILNHDPKNEQITGAAESFYNQLQQEDIEVLLDDRDERPGSKFKDADLLGIPYRITIGKRFAQEAEVEVRTRRDGLTKSLSFDKAVIEVVNAIQDELKATKEK